MDPTPQNPIQPGDPGVYPMPDPARVQPDRGRLTVIQQIYFQPVDGEAPVGEPFGWSCEPRSDELPYKRASTVGEEWVRLDLGWAGQRPSLLTIRHRPQSRTVQPTDAEKAADEARRLLVGIEAAPGVVKAVCQIPPGAFNDLTEPAELWVRSSEGKCRYSVFAAPE